MPDELFRTLRDQHPMWRHPTVPTTQSPRVMFRHLLNRFPDLELTGPVTGVEQTVAVSLDDVPVRLQPL